MKTVLVLLSAILLSIFGCGENEKPTTPSETPKYKLILRKTGEGKCEAIPEKEGYNAGEEVTVKATADSGWEFVRWEGNVMNPGNPLLIKMERDMVVSAAFEKLYLPLITGEWTSDRWAIDLELTQQSRLSPIITGFAYLTSNSVTHTYKVTGNNYPPNIVMTWTKSGYYPIYVNCNWIDYARMEGTFKENNNTYAFTLLRGDTPNNKLSRLNLNPKTIK